MNEEFLTIIRTVPDILCRVHTVHAILPRPILWPRGQHAQVVRAQKRLCLRKLATHPVVFPAQTR